MFYTMLYRVPECISDACLHSSSSLCLLAIMLLSAHHLQVKL